MDTLKCTMCDKDFLGLPSEDQENVCSECAEYLSSEIESNFPYSVKINVSALNVRNGPGKDHKITKILVCDKNLHTIVDETTDSEENKWGKLKSGLGWVSLNHVVKA